MTEPDFRPLIEFLESRLPWFTIAVVPALSGSPGAYDVVLRIDGTYFDSKVSRELFGPIDTWAASLRQEFAEAMVAAGWADRLADWHQQPPRTSSRRPARTPR